MDVAICTGSNLGARREHLERADQLLGERLGAVRARSAIYETSPLGALDQPSYCNQVLLLETERDPFSLLASLQQIEIDIGRVRSDTRWASRIIDIDILTIGSVIIDSPQLRVPHPEMYRRDFALEGLREILPQWIDPRSGKSVPQLLEDASIERTIIRQ